MSWNTTDNEWMRSGQYHLLENGAADADGINFITSMYSSSQLLSALNDRQRRFMKDTGCVVTRKTSGGTPQVSRYPLPTDWIDTRRVTWTPQGGSTYSLMRTDTFELDQGMTDWQYNFADPTMFHESTLPTLTLEIAKAPSNAGKIGLLYVALSTTLDNSGIPMTIPDEFCPFVLMGAIGDLLSFDGEGNDPQRAEFCFMFYDMGVEMARILMRGTQE